MATIENSYTGDGSQTLYSFTFPYISEVDVTVSVDSVVQTLETEYVFANATTISFNTALLMGRPFLSVVRQIRRILRLSSSLVRPFGRGI